MPNAPTPILGLTVPTVGGDAGTWGNELNTDLGILDSLGALTITASSVGRTLAYGVNAIAIANETAGAGGITDTLPNAINHAGRGFIVKKVDSGAGAVTFATTGSQTIDGLATYALTNQYQYVLLVSDGANWGIYGNN